MHDSHGGAEKPTLLLCSGMRVVSKFHTWSTGEWEELVAPLCELLNSQHCRGTAPVSGSVAS